MNSINVLTDFSPTMFTDTGAPLVSIYLKTHRTSPENRQDKMRYKNLINETETALAQNYGKREYTALLENLESLLDDSNRDIWRFAKDGLAILADGSTVSLYHLDYPVDDIAIVADSFHIKPLIRNFQYGAHYYLLALSAKSFDLYDGDFSSIEKIEMPEGVEREFDKVFDDFDNTSTINVGAFAGMDGRFYGRDSKSEIVEKEIIKFFRYVDKTVSEHFLSEHPYPVIVVSLAQHQSAFKSISTISTLLDQGIDKPVESMSESELLARAKSIIRSVQESSVRKLIDGFDLALSQDRASADPRTIAHALVERKVSVLFVEERRLVPGKFDKETGSVSNLTESNGTSVHDDIIDDFAQAAYLQGGSVYTLEAEVIPSDSGVAALFRY